MLKSIPRRLAALAVAFSLVLPVAPAAWAQESSLHAAARHSADRVRESLDAGNPINARCCGGQSPLHLALTANNLNPQTRKEIVQVLLDAGASPFLPNDSIYHEPGHVTPLHLAATQWNDANALVLAKAANWTAQDAARANLGDGGRSASDPSAKTYRLQLTPLHWALRPESMRHRHRVRIVEHLLQAGAHPGARSIAEDTPLHFAAYRSPKIVRLLLDAGKNFRDFNINAQNHEGATALHFAIYGGATDLDDGTVADVVRILLEHGANPELQTRGKTAVEWARFMHRGDEILAMLQDPAEVAPQYTLHRAVRRGPDSGPDKVREILSQGGNVNHQNHKGETPLHWALTKNDDPEIVQILLDSGANPFIQDNEGATPLHLAATRWDGPHSKVRKRAMDLRDSRGVNAQTRQGETPLHWAASGQHSGWGMTPFAFGHVVYDFLQAGADPRIRDGNGVTPVHWAPFRGVKGFRRMLNTAMRRGFDINAADNNGDTPLHWAAAKWRSDLADGTLADVIRIFLKRNPNTFLRNKRGETAQDVARRQNRGAEVIGLLDPEKANLFSAARGSPETMRRALALNSDVNAQNSNGATALHWALTKNAGAEVVQILLDAGANPFIPDNEGVTPLHLSATRWDGPHSKVRKRATSRRDPGNINLQTRRGETALHWAASGQHSGWGMTPFAFGHTAYDLLQAGADPRIRDGNGVTAVHWATFRGVKGFERILNAARDFDINTADNNGDTALHWAVAKWKSDLADGTLADVVRILLGRGADLSLPNHRGETARELARKHGRGDEVVALLELESESEAQIALHPAARESAEQVRKALAQGRDVNAQVDGETALHWALKKDAGLTPRARAEIVRELMEAGADPFIQDHDGVSSLHWAASEWGRAHFDVARRAIGMDGDVNVKTDDGETALHWALLRGNSIPHGGRVRLAAALLSGGGNPGVGDANGVTPLHRAAGLSAEILRRMLDAAENLEGFDINARDNEGASALHWAVNEGESNLENGTAAEVVRMLLDHGADASAQNNDDETALDLALNFGLDEVVALLDRTNYTEALLVEEIKKRASGETRSDSEILRVLGGIARSGGDLRNPPPGEVPALFLAASFRQTEVVRLLVQIGGADVNVRNPKTDSTAAHMAALLRNAEMLAALVELGADLSLRDGSGVAPFCKLSAAERSNMAIALLDYASDAADMARKTTRAIGLCN